MQAHTIPHTERRPACGTDHPTLLGDKLEHIERYLLHSLPLNEGSAFVVGFEGV